MRQSGRTSEQMKAAPKGDFYEDSRELSWGELGQSPELTTVTGRVRRVATLA